MDIEGDFSRYRELLVFLIAAALVVPLAHRLRISPILAFLAVGVLIGPYGLAATLPGLGGVLITNDENVRFLAELGVVFLLFTIGLDLPLRRLMSMRLLVFGLGGLQVALTAAVIAGIAILFGNSPAVAIILGTALSLSSTAIVMQMLTESGRLGTPLGRAAFAVLLMQDLAVIPILFITSALGQDGSGSLLGELAMACATAALVIAFIVMVGNRLIGPVFRLAGSMRSPDVFVAAALLVIVVTGMATAAAGLSVALGAFLAGLLLSDTEYRHELEVTIGHFKGLLLGLFFLSVGMGINLAAVAKEPLWVPLSVVGLIAIKAVILILLGLVFRLGLAVAMEVGLLLSQGGEFAFVVVGSALRVEAIEGPLGEFMLLVVGVTMALAPLLARAAEGLGRGLGRRGLADAEPPPDALEGTRKVVIAGFGRVGQMLSILLEANKIPYLALERDVDVVRNRRMEGAPVYYGDASRPETLRRLDLSRIVALVVTTDDGRAAEHIVSVAHGEAPELFILARARDAEHGRQLLALGADEVVPETIEASLQLGHALLLGIGVDPELAEAGVEERRRFERNAIGIGRAAAD